ncbi:SLAF1 protein, partial [Buphagus erythrorhynchus]|nr:SLAF1 protein [Buphagus erythrorhynchus]
MEEPQKKKILLRISGANVTEYERERMRFHEGNFSLEILDTRRDDERLYEYSVSRGPEEELWQIQLRVLEAVAAPSIRILHREWSNGSCSLALLCSSERGDEVSYAWDGGLCSGGRGRALNVSFPPGGAAPRCVCTASNRVSRRRAALQGPPCAPRPP